VLLRAALQQQQLQQRLFTASTVRHQVLLQQRFFSVCVVELCMFTSFSDHQSPPALIQRQYVTVGRLMLRMQYQTHMYLEAVQLQLICVNQVSVILQKFAQHMLMRNVPQCAVVSVIAVWCISALSTLVIIQAAGAMY
jgi:hypothetical protein